MSEHLLEILVWARAGERLLTVVVAGVSVIIGWHLFLKGVVTEQAGTLEGWGLKVGLQRVGPGVFFALFGVGVLLFAISAPLEFSKEQANLFAAASRENSRGAPPIVEGETPDTSHSKKINARYLGQNEEHDRAYARALNTFIRYEKLDALEETHPPLARDWQQALPYLEEIRNIIVSQQFSQAELTTGLALLGPHGFRRGEANPEDRALLSDLEPWLLHTIAMEPKR